MSLAVSPSGGRRVCGAGVADECVGNRREREKTAGGGRDEEEAGRAGRRKRRFLGREKKPVLRAGVAD